MLTTRDATMHKVTKNNIIYEKKLNIIPYARESTAVRERENFTVIELI